MLGLATDGARTMLGCHGGVAAKLTKNIFHLVVIHCAAHKLQLALLDLLKAVPFMQEAEKTLRGLYIHYHSSPKRSLQLKEVAAKLLGKDQSFPHLCKQAMLRPERFPERCYPN